MTLIITLYVLLLSSVGSHAQRTMADIEYELKQDLHNTELELASYYTSYKKQQEELSDHVKTCSDIRLKYYSCDYEHMFDMTYILHGIQIEYKTLCDKANGDYERAILYKRKIRRLYCQLEVIRRLNPALPPLSAVPDSIREISSDSLVSKIYSSAGYTNDAMTDWTTLDSVEQRQRLRCIDYAVRLITIYNIYLKNDETLRNRYVILRNDFRGTYNESLESFKLLQHDIIFKHSMPYLAIISNSGKMFEDMFDMETTRIKVWDKKNSDSGIWVLLVQVLLGFLLALLIVYSITFVTRNKPDRFAHIKRHKWLWIWTLTDILWFVAIVISLYLAPYELVLAGGITILVYFAFLLSIRLSNMLVSDEKAIMDTIQMYSPITTMGFLIMMFRLLFVPDSLLAMQLFPFSLALFVWQMVILRRHWAKVNRFDAILALTTSVVLLTMAIASFFGYIYLSIALFYWWQCQIMILSGIAVLLALLKFYYKRVIIKRIARYYEDLGYSYNPREDRPIQITWLYDLVDIALVPLLVINSFSISLDLALYFFNAESIFHRLYYHVFYSYAASDGSMNIVLSFANIVLVVSLFFIFKFICHLLVNIYKQIKKDIIRRRVDADQTADATVNFTLGSNLISFIVWIGYAISVFTILQIPMQSLAFVFAGLATGIGFAMKDIINNLFYGMQLMAGRLKVGDYVICDSYRGAVKSISYQTTQMLTEEGALVCFGNADLFSKNFQNLTSHNPYEVNRVTFYVPYGSDVTKAEQLARDATERLNTHDKYGRPLLSPEEGIRIEFRDMGASSVEMAVRFGVIAQKRTWFLPVLREAVYNELVSHGFTIPYNQLDLHIVNGNGIPNL